MSTDTPLPVSSLDRETPSIVASAAIEALLADDMARVAALSHVPAEELAQLEAQGMSYDQMLEMMLMTGGPEQYGGGTLIEAMKRLYDGGFDEIIEGEVPKVGRIAVAVLGSLDGTGERFLVAQLTPSDEGWALVGLPKTMPKGMLDQLR